MTKMEYDIYCKWNDWLSEQFSLRPKAYIYLRCPPEVNVDRIAKITEGECGIPLEYLKQPKMIIMIVGWQMKRLPSSIDN